MTENDLKTDIERCLRKLGVVRAAKEDDPLRWSVSDLATDLAPLLHEELKGWLDLEHEAGATAAVDSIDRLLQNK